MSRPKRINGLALRTRPPTEEERIREIIEVFRDLEQKLTPELIANQFYAETGKSPNRRLVMELIK